MIDLETSVLTHAEIFEEFPKKSSKWLVRASHSETRNGTQASDVVKEGN